MTTPDSPKAPHSEHLYARAERARQRAKASYERAHQLVDNIPVGQPILVGHHSEGRHRRALQRSDAAMAACSEALKEAERLELAAQRTEHYEAQLATADDEGVAIGDEVIARFTNSGRYWRFRGVVVGRALRYWKVKALESPGEAYGTAAVGRIFHIAAVGSREYSANNRLHKP